LVLKYKQPSHGMANLPNSTSDLQLTTTRLIKVWLSTKAYNFSPVMALMPFLTID